MREPPRSGSRGDGLAAARELNEQVHRRARAFWFASVCGSARPDHERDLRCLIEYARWAWREAAARQHVLRGAPGSDLGEHRTAPGDADMGRVRQVELVVADVEKQSVHIGPADHRDHSLRYAEPGQGLYERGAVRIPQQ